MRLAKFECVCGAKLELSNDVVSTSGNYGSAYDINQRDESRIDTWLDSHRECVANANKPQAKTETP